MPTPDPLAPLAPLARRDGDPVFEEAWQAQALAMADCMVKTGAFSATDWAAALGRAVRAEDDTTGGYYRAVLAALETLLDGLFHIAQADGALHENEILFLETVAEIFDLPDSVFEEVRLRNLPARDRSSYDLLGVSPDMPLAEIRRHWRRLAARLHPDRLQGEGLPPEAVRLTEQRLASINAAWDSIRRDGRAATPQPGI